MKAVILHQSISKHDAIGNDIAHMCAILKKTYNTAVYVYCDYIQNNNLNKISKDELLDTIKKEENLIIYHHSTYWKEGEQILDQSKSKVIIRYHNITPHCYFEPYNLEFTIKCKSGREQTKRIQNKYSDFLWMGASSYNFWDAEIKDDTKAVVVPPFNNTARWEHIAPREDALQSLLESESINLLFVGRVAPNKGHKFLFRLLQDYTLHYDTKIVLHIIGKRDEHLYSYNQELDDLAERCALNAHLHWVGEVDDALLLSYYLGCDFYLNCSDHEGFCVPLIEAQSLYLPVIAKNTSGVSETLGEHQLILGDNPQEYSAAIRVLSRNPSYRNYLVENGFKNYWNRFRNAVIEDTFVRAVEQFAGVHS